MSAPEVALVSVMTSLRLTSVGVSCDVPGHATGAAVVGSSAILYVYVTIALSLMSAAVACTLNVKVSPGCIVEGTGMLLPIPIFLSGAPVSLHRIDAPGGTPVSIILLSRGITVGFSCDVAGHAIGLGRVSKSAILYVNVRKRGINQIVLVVTFEPDLRSDRKGTAR
jgi:hypothetical protein